MALTLAVVGGWQIAMLVEYTRGIFMRIPTLFT
jgi:flagellar biosynthesis protein FliQ